MKVLIIEDDTATVDTISLALGFRWPDVKVLSTSKGTEGVRLVERESPDVVILDLGLPDVDGIKALAEMRRVSAVPVIIVSGRTEQTAVIKGLELGADDYITKPFDPMVFLARVNSVLRRVSIPEGKVEEKPLVCGDLAIDFANRQVICRGKSVKLTPIEWDMFYWLVKNEDRVITYQVLWEKVWRGEHLGDVSPIRTCVWRIRAKLGDDTASPKIIVGERGIGYRFIRPT